MSTSPSSASGLVKMSELARLSGVPAATIKHYLREGLLPPPQVKTGRNMAFYDRSLVARIERIKALQREHFLPLRHIRSVLEGQPSPDDDVETVAAIERALATTAGDEARTRAQLIAGGLPARELALFESIGLVTAVRADGEDVFRGDDLALLRLLGTARRAGINAEMLPAETLQAYVKAIEALVRVELEMFRSGVIPRAGANLGTLTESATRMSEQLVVLIRRKLLLPTLRSLAAKRTERAAGGAAPARSRRRPRERA